MRFVRTRGLVLVIVLAMVGSGLAVPLLSSAPGGASSHATTPALAPASPAAAPSPGAVSAASAPHPMPAAPGASTQTASAGWNSSNFFTDVSVNFYGTGLPYGFRTVPYVNDISSTTFGFWMNITATAPILFANVTIWGTQWPGLNSSQPITGYTPVSPALHPMVVNRTDPAQASFFFDNYRFFWPGSSVSFNLTVVGENSTPSEITSAANVTVAQNYPGGYTDLATWVFNVGTPWASSNFTNDIAVATTPNILGPVVYAPNPMQAFDVTISSIPVQGYATPIPAAALTFTVDLNGTVTSYSDPFGPVNSTTMSLVQSIGPYPGATVAFNITAWMPWQGGALDRIQSLTYRFTWSPNGGWWNPLGGLLDNVQLLTSPSVGSLTGPIAGSTVQLPTDQPLALTLHEPIENVSIGSAQVVYTFSDNGHAHSGTLAMTALSDNTTTATIPGLPPGSQMTFYLVAKDIYGDPIASGNYSYEESGPTSPSLPAGRGLVFLEVLDLSTGALARNFTYALSNATWSTSGSAYSLGYASPTLPASAVPIQLGFGTYAVTVHDLGHTQRATIVLSGQTPTPVVVFFQETQPVPQQPSQTISVESILAAGGLVAAAVITLPLVQWFDERRARAEEEQRRVTL